MAQPMDNLVVITANGCGPCNAFKQAAGGIGLPLLQKELSGTTVQLRHINLASLGGAMPQNIPPHLANMIRSFPTFMMIGTDNGWSQSSRITYAEAYGGTVKIGSPPVATGPPPSRAPASIAAWAKNIAGGRGIKSQINPAQVVHPAQQPIQYVSRMGMPTNQPPYTPPKQLHATANSPQSRTSPTSQRVYGQAQYSGMHSR